MDATPEVFLPATHRKCSFPRQQLISADRVVHKDDELVGPIIKSSSHQVTQSAIETVRQRASIDQTLS